MSYTLAAVLVATGYLQYLMRSRTQREPAGVSALLKGADPTPPVREVVAAPKLPWSWSRKDAAKDFDGLPEVFAATQVAPALGHRAPPNDLYRAYAPRPREGAPDGVTARDIP
jgi:hypothetical protein